MCGFADVQMERFREITNPASKYIFGGCCVALVRFGQRSAAPVNRGLTVQVYFSHLLRMVSEDEVSDTTKML
jgi:hypothetical protein